MLLVKLEEPLSVGGWVEQPGRPGAMVRGASGAEVKRRARGGPEECAEGGVRGGGGGEDGACTKYRGGGRWPGWRPGAVMGGGAGRGGPGLTWRGSGVVVGAERGRLRRRRGGGAMVLACFCCLLFVCYRQKVPVTR